MTVKVTGLYLESIRLTSCLRWGSKLKVSTQTLDARVQWLSWSWHIRVQRSSIFTLPFCVFVHLCAVWGVCWSAKSRFCFEISPSAMHVEIRFKCFVMFISFAYKLFERAPPQLQTFYWTEGYLEEFRAWPQRMITCLAEHWCNPPKTFPCSSQPMDVHHGVLDRHPISHQLAPAAFSIRRQRFSALLLMGRSSILQLPSDSWPSSQGASSNRSGCFIHGTCRTE